MDDRRETEPGLLSSRVQKVPARGFFVTNLCRTKIKKQCNCLERRIKKSIFCHSFSGQNFIV